MLNFAVIVIAQVKISAMTKDDFAETYKQLNEAEAHAAKLEKMLDNLDAKMESILKDAENLAQKPDNEKPKEDKN